uniref:Progestin and adipoQ receptor family member 5 n=1 Tax=Oryctolagus cuniculus TaxID=9986 RepID=A0A5F9D8R9_RABIT
MSQARPPAALPGGLTMLSLKLPRLFRIDQVPQVFHEQGILFGYRHPQSSATACILSLFQMTNETLNIWTHLLPFWFFVWRFVTALYVTDIPNDSYSWPMLVYMCTSCVYPLASSCAHTFSSMSRNARHICYFLDYGAVNLFSLGSAIAYSAYAFPDALVRTSFHDYFVTMAVLNTILSTGLSCYSRFLEIQKPGLCKLLRILAFAYPYTWDSLPIFYRVRALPDGAPGTHGSPGPGAAFIALGKGSGDGSHRGPGRQCDWGLGSSRSEQRGAGSEGFCRVSRRAGSGGKPNSRCQSSGRASSLCLDFPHLYSEHQGNTSDQAVGRIPGGNLCSAAGGESLMMYSLLASSQVLVLEQRV